MIYSLWLEEILSESHPENKKQRGGGSRRGDALSCVMWDLMTKKYREAFLGLEATASFN